jgi:hypothetical protein
VTNHPALKPPHLIRRDLANAANAEQRQVVVGHGCRVSALYVRERGVRPIDRINLDSRGPRGREQASRSRLAPRARPNLLGSSRVWYIDRRRGG